MFYELLFFFSPYLIAFFFILNFKEINPKLNRYTFFVLSFFRFPCHWRFLRESKNTVSLLNLLADSFPTISFKISFFLCSIFYAFYFVIEKFFSSAQSITFDLTLRTLRAIYIKIKTQTKKKKLLEGRKRRKISKPIHEKKA